MLEVGKPAPPFQGRDQNGNEVSLKDFAGKKLVLYFYPKDNTPGCTAEACDLRDNQARLQAAGYEIVGVSKDSEASHKKFAEKHALPFPLVSDPSTEILQAYGAWGEKKAYGKTSMGTLRKTVLIDQNGIVEQIINKVDTKAHASQILDTIAS